MKSHLRQVTKKKVSDFLLREEGMIGNRTGFATAALVSTTSLAATLLVAADAIAHGNHPHWCGGGAGGWCWDEDEKCCSYVDPGGNWDYWCQVIWEAC